jgi:hypothetical protein
MYSIKILHPWITYLMIIIILLIIIIIIRYLWTNKHDNKDDNKEGFFVDNNSIKLNEIIRKTLPNIDPIKTVSLPINPLQIFSQVSINANNKNQYPNFIIYVPDITVKGGDIISLPIYYYGKSSLQNFNIGIIKIPKLYSDYSFTSVNFKSTDIDQNLDQYNVKLVSEYRERFVRTDIIKTSDIYKSYLNKSPYPIELVCYLNLTIASPLNTTIGSNNLRDFIILLYLYDLKIPIVDDYIFNDSRTYSDTTAIMKSASIFCNGYSNVRECFPIETNPNDDTLSIINKYRQPSGYSEWGVIANNVNNTLNYYIFSLLLRLLPKPILYPDNPMVLFPNNPNALSSTSKDNLYHDICMYVPNMPLKGGETVSLPIYYYGNTYLTYFILFIYTFPMNVKNPTYFTHYNVTLENSDTFTTKKIIDWAMVALEFTRNPTNVGKPGLELLCYLNLQIPDILDPTLTNLTQLPIIIYVQNNLTGTNSKQINLPISLRRKPMATPPQPPWYSSISTYINGTVKDAIDPKFYPLIISSMDTDYLVSLDNKFIYTVPPPN